MLEEKLVADPIANASAVTAQNRRTQEPKDPLALLEIDLRQDIYGPHADDSVVE